MNYDITDDEWQEVYNSTDHSQGQYRGYNGEPGTFYQTYGNGGGPNGWGGYWVRDNCSAVWEVNGNKFKYLDGCSLKIQPQQEMKGIICAVRLIPYCPVVWLT